MELIAQYYEQTEDLSIEKFRNADLIFPSTKGLGGLFLGDFTAAQDIDYLKANKITCILTVAAVTKFAPPKSLVKAHLKILADDSPTFKLNTFYNQCFKFIHENRMKGRNVLVHCMAGISRSAAIMMGYIMATEGMSLEMAYKFVRKKRVAAFPNLGFVKQLKDYEKELKLCRMKNQKVF